MEPLRDSGPVLPERRLALRKAHVMSEITMAATTERPRRRATVVLVAVGASLAIGGGVAVAAGVNGGSIWRQADGSVAIDGSQLRPAYQGRYLSASELSDLQAKGKAMASANNEELACQGISLYFDTEAELEAYNADFDARHPMTSRVADSTGDPCAAYADSPKYVTSGN